LLWFVKKINKAQQTRIFVHEKAKKKAPEGFFLFFAEFREFFIELVNSTRGINELEFTGKERM
jgi:hypothetical protein